MASKGLSVLNGDVGEDKKLDKRETKLVVLYTREGGHEYLDRIKSYTTAGYGGRCNGKLLNANALAKFRQPHIQAAIRKLLPQIAFDQMYVRTEMKELYLKLKTDDKTREQADMLKEMAKICGLHDKDTTRAIDKTEDPSEHIQAFNKQANELWQKRIGVTSENISEKIS